MAKVSKTKSIAEIRFEVVCSKLVPTKSFVPSFDLKNSGASS